MKWMENKEWRPYAAVSTAAGICVVLIECYFSIPCALTTAGALLFVHGVMASFIKSRYEKMADLSLLIDRILHGDEKICLDKYKEGEFSILESEISKMVIRLREQNSMLLEDKKSLSKSLADISHQLRTPLTSLNLIASMLCKYELTDREEEQKRRRLLQEMTILLDRVDWLITTLLKMSRLDAGCIVMKKEKIQVEQLIHTAANPLFIPLELRNIALQVCIPSHMAFVGDLQWTSEAVGNILKNCMEHTDEGGVITVLGKENPVYDEIIIEDTGRGIESEALPHLFERFYKGKNSDKNSFGIGLSLAKQIMENQNGLILAENREDGNGSRFCIRFYKTVV